ncbi:MAG: hypothetical protein JOY81_06580 [Alphaproteobacteria bacterium]|nr:hypothetical protein [Alphaproteobacteria bacterium]
MTVILPTQAAETLLTLAPRPGATLRVLTDRPAQPIGSVVLLAGNDGVLDLDAQGNIGTDLKVNHVVRTRASYVAAGYATFVPDVASDLKGTSRFRFKADFAQDLALIVREARKLGKPVAVIGTSRGALAVGALLVNRSVDQPDAAVISSGVLMGTDKWGSASTMGDWSAVRIPVLLLRHALDGCKVSAPADADKFKPLLTSAPKVDIVTMTGGGPSSPQADPCGALHFHGFYEIDDKVVQTTVAWLRANMK